MRLPQNRRDSQTKGAEQAKDFCGLLSSSLQQPTVSSLISKFSDPRDHGIVFGLYHGLLSLARVAGPLVAGVAFHWLRGTGQFIVAAGLVVIMSIWTLVLRQPTPHDATPEAMGEAALEPG